MSDMRVEKDCVKNIPLSKRPFGYIFICCDNLDTKYQVFFGEIQIRAENLSSTLRYCVDYVDVSKRYYRLQLFKDREFQEILSYCHVEFSISDSRKFNIFRTEEKSPMPSEIFNLMHIVIYERIIEQLLPQIQSMRSHASPEQIKIPFTVSFGFRSDVPDDFFNETYTTLESLILLLRVSLKRG